MLRKPLVTGVSTGPFNATRVARIDSTVCAGSVRPVRENAPAPIG